MRYHDLVCRCSFYFICFAHEAKFLQSFACFRWGLGLHFGVRMLRKPHWFNKTKSQQGYVMYAWLAFVGKHQKTGFGSISNHLSWLSVVLLPQSRQCWLHRRINVHVRRRFRATFNARICTWWILSVRAPDRCKELSSRAGCAGMNLPAFLRRVRVERLPQGDARPGGPSHVFQVLTKESNVTVTHKAPWQHTLFGGSEWAWSIGSGQELSTDQVFVSIAPQVLNRGEKLTSQS